MTPRKKQHNSAKDRVAASRDRKAAEGLRQVQIWLTNEAIDKLDKLVKEENATSRGQVIEAMIQRRKV